MMAVVTWAPPEQKPSRGFECVWFIWEVIQSNVAWRGGRETRKGTLPVKSAYQVGYHWVQLELSITRELQKPGHKRTQNFPTAG